MPAKCFNESAFPRAGDSGNSYPDRFSSIGEALFNHILGSLGMPQVGAFKQSDSLTQDSKVT